jgi:hypothetical protein
MTLFLWLRMPVNCRCPPPAQDPDPSKSTAEIPFCPTVHGPDGGSLGNPADKTWREPSWGFQEHPLVFGERHRGSISLIQCLEVMALGWDTDVGSTAAIMGREGTSPVNSHFASFLTEFFLQWEGALSDLPTQFGLHRANPDPKSLFFSSAAMRRLITWGPVIVTDQCCSAECSTMEEGSISAPSHSKSHSPCEDTVHLTCD